MHDIKIGDVVKVMDARRGDRHGPYGDAGNDKSRGPYNYLVGREAIVTGKWGNGVCLSTDKGAVSAFYWRISPANFSLENE